MSVVHEFSPYFLDHLLIGRSWAMTILCVVVPQRRLG